MLATMTSKGQITIPKPARDALQLHPGDRVEFVFGDDGCLFLLAVTRPVDSLKGMLPKPAHPVSPEEMDAAIAASVRPYTDATPMCRCAISRRMPWCN